MQEDGAGEGMAGFALIEVSMRAAAQGGVQEPITDKDRAFDAADLPQRLGECILARRGGDFLAVIFFLRITDGGTRPAAIEAQSRSISSQFSSTMARLAVPPISSASGA